MPLLQFDVHSNYEEVIRLRTEIANLESALRSFGPGTAESTIRSLENQLSSCQGKLRSLLDDAAKSGVESFVHSATEATKVLGQLNSLSPEEKLSQLSVIVRDNEVALNSLNLTLQEYKSQAQEAFAAGNLGTFQAISADIEDVIKSIQDVRLETEQYRSALETLKTATGQESQESVSAPKLFASQEDYEYAQHLKEEIASLQEQVAKFDEDGSRVDLQVLRTALVNAQNELRGVEVRAASAASSLGADLGGRAAEASSHLYQLNIAIEKQKSTVETLRTELDETSKAMASLQEKGDIDAYDAAQVKLQNLSAELQNATNKLLVLQAEQQNAQTAWANVSGEVQRHESILVKLLGGQEKYNQIIGMMPAPLQAAASGITGMTGAAKAFIATPLGAILAAIILAVKALTTWFNSSAEGQMAFAKVSGYVSGVLGQLKEIVIAVGKAIYNAFKDPQKAIKDLWNVIKENVVNRFKAVGDIAGALGKVVKAAFTLDTDGIKAGLKELTDGLLKFGTGVENVTGKMANWAKSVHEAATATSNIAVAEKQLDVEVAKWQKRKAELDKIKAEASAKMYDTSLSKSKRKEALNQYKAALKEQQDMELKFADRRIELQKERMEITTNSLEDNAKLDELEANRVRIEAQGARALASLQRRVNAINNAKDDDPLERAYEVAKMKKEEGERLAKMERERIQAETDLRISKMKEGTEKEIATAKNEAKKKLDALSELVRNEVKRVKDEEQKEWIKANSTQKHKAKAYKWKQSKTDAEYESDAINRLGISTQRADIELEESKKLEKILLKDKQALWGFLKEYGNYKQKRLAIEADYREKMKDASLGDRLKLEAELKKALSSLDMSQLKDTIHWEAVFNDLDSLSIEYLTKLKNQLKETLSKEDIGAENAKVIAQQIDKINAQLTSRQKEWKSALGLVIPELERINRLKKEQLLAQEKLNEATKKQQGAESRKSLIQGTIFAVMKGSGINVDLKDISTENAEDIKTLYRDAGGDVEKLAEIFAKLAQAEQDVTESSEEVVKTQGEEEVANDKLKKSFKGTLSVIGGAIDAVNRHIQSANEFIQTIGLGDSGFGRGFSNFAESSQSVSSAIKSAIEGDVFGVLNGVVGAIGSLGDALGEWGISFMGSSDKTLERDIETLTATNEALAAAIQELTNEMKDVSIAEVGELYGQTKADIEASMRNTQEMMQRTGAAYNDGFLGIGGDHSSNYDINEGMSSVEWARVTNAAGVAVNSAGDFWNLTSKQMAEVAKKAPDLYGKIKALASEGYQDASVYMDTYIGYWKQLEELENAYKESLTDISIDSISDQFKSLLLDMESSAEDFSNNFETMMRNAVVNSLMTSRYNDMLKEWYDEFAEMMQSDNKLDAYEQKQLKAQYDKIVSGARSELKDLEDMMGWDTSQTQKSSSRAIQGISEDTGNAIEGRLTAVQIAVESIRTSEEQESATLADLSTKMLTMLTTQSRYSLYYEGIQKQISDCHLELMAINDNTAAVVKPIKSMSETIEKIEKKIKNL